MVIALLVTWDLPQLLIASIIDSISTKSIEEIDKAQIFLKCLYIFLLMSLGFTMIRVNTHFYNKRCAKLQKEMFDESFEKLINKSVNFYSNNFIGELVNKITRFTDNFDFFSDALYYETSSLLARLLFGVVALLILEPILALFLVLIVFLYSLAVIKPFKTRFHNGYVASKLQSSLTGKLADSFTNIITVKSFASEKTELADFEDKNFAYHRQLRKWWNHSNAYCHGVNSVFLTFGYALSILIAVYSVFYLGAKPSLIFLTFIIFKNLLTTIWQLGHILERMQAVFSFGNESLSLINSSDVIHDNQEVSKVPNQESVSIEIAGLSFAYDKVDIFSDFNLTVLPKEKIGLVGPSGGGKSSLVKLLLRFSDVDAGVIRINGVAISEVPQTILRSLIAYVPQEPLLFHKTIRENIIYPKTEINEEEFQDAVEKAYVNEFVEGLPKGYETTVGERGVKLSGGQKQRIVIARAMLQSAPVLILDEATSALDSESEKYIQKALVELMSSKTVISIAHRLSTIAHLDKIIVMESGRIVQSGSHTELLKEDGMYKTLWGHQSGNYIGID
jgi:ATP-binding cassette subfamily B protein